MPPKRHQYEVDEYVFTHSSEAMASQQHTQYEMGNTLRASRVKTVVTIEHEEDFTLVTNATDVPDLMEVNNNSDNEGHDNGHDHVHGDEADHELEAAGLGEICSTEAGKSKRVHKAHTVSNILDDPGVTYLLNL